MHFLASVYTSFCLSLLHSGDFPPDVGDVTIMYELKDNDHVVQSGSKAAVSGEPCSFSITFDRLKTYTLCFSFKESDSNQSTWLGTIDYNSISTFTKTGTGSLYNHLLLTEILLTPARQIIGFVVCDSN